jgi:hypothetical protein
MCRLHVSADSPAVLVTAIFFSQILIAKATPHIGDLDRPSGFATATKIRQSPTAGFDGSNSPLSITHEAQRRAPLERDHPTLLKTIAMTRPIVVRDDSLPVGAAEASGWSH